MSGPDLPAPDQPFDIDAWQYRWPSGTEKAELYDGVLVFSGKFDERDIPTAQGAFPGRHIVLNDSGGIEIHPAGKTPPRSIFETFIERLAQRENNPLR
ncbi:hypothetical protein [Umezawaea sp. Da 62-37]|uniref:hypothetical protein n=1 Tax=Umezawaea sp. Da 62-37 TaxID=3075927 RepID=UPI0028F70810|nr:hypothetical protein [Umezawaea sp. Da 62-37]WNV82909.1 hypothetical protein RM788_32550 [Umezawaea sp. Da 62-37]